MNSAMPAARSNYQFVNPKRRSDGERLPLPWSQYYAGFSEKFAHQALYDLCKDRVKPMVMDLWNGSGTTTTAASRLGIRSIGIDINPVMRVVASARCISSSDLPLARINLHQARERIQDSPCEIVEVSIEREPLLTWFSPQTAATIRSMFDAFLQQSRDHSGSLSATPADALVLLAMFSVVRQLLGRFRTSNPTWLRDPRDCEALVSSSKSELLSLFEQTGAKFIEELSRRISRIDTIEAPELIVANAERIPLESGSVSVVLSSPPYCTRIDYAVACKPELAVMGFSMGSEFRRLRNSMLGTPTIADGKPIDPTPVWGPTCLEVVHAVQYHYSKASATYYSKTLLQYFDSLYRSIGEASRIIEERGTMVLVVQDSFYKEIQIDLAQVVQEMSTSQGMYPRTTQAFPARTSMRSVNSRSRGYNAHGTAVESVVVLEKP